MNPSIAPATGTSRTLRARMRHALDHVREDAALHAFILAYALVTLAIASATGVPQKFTVWTYFGWLVVGMGPAASLMLVVWGVWALRKPSPLAAVRDSARAALSHPAALSIALMAVSLMLFKAIFISAKTMLTDVVPFHSDVPLAELDRALHGRDPWTYAHALLPSDLARPLESLYFPVWGMAMQFTTLAVLVLPGLRHVRRQYLWAFLLVWPVLGNITAAAFMSAGPVYFERVGGDGRFSALLSHVADVTLLQEAGREMLWNFHLRGEGGTGAGISAFPSLHVACVTLLVLVAARINRWLMAVALSYALVVLFGSVYLGWHYAIDGYVSIVATVLLWIAAGKLAGNRAKSAPVSAEASVPRVRGRRIAWARLGK